MEAQGQEGQCSGGRGRGWPGGMQRILGHLLWKEHQEAQPNALTVRMGKLWPSQQTLLGRGP